MWSDLQLQMLPQVESGLATVACIQVGAAFLHVKHPVFSSCWRSRHDSPIELDKPDIDIMGGMKSSPAERVALVGQFSYRW